MKVSKCRGFRDLLPDETSRLRQVDSILADTCRRWGFNEIKTPTLEYLYLFTSAGTLTPSRLDRVYSFLDWDGWSGERVVLRPDATIPVARYYIEQEEHPSPARLFYISNTFMFEETGKKPRETWQGGAEIIGTGSAAVDAELILLAQDIIRAIGLGNAEVRLSHIGLLRAFLAQTGYTMEEQNALLDRILDGDISVLDQIKSTSPEGSGLLEVLAGLNGKSSGFLKNVKALLPAGSEYVVQALDDFIAATEILEATGCNYEIDLGSARGFEYYTGLTFRFFIDSEAIGGGGRYDALISLLGGEETPAAGFALYLDQLTALLIGKNASEAGHSNKILICFEGEKAAEAFKIGQELREAGYITVLSPGLSLKSGYHFIVEVNAHPPFYSLTTSQGGKRVYLNTPEGIVANLREANRGA